MDHGQKFQLVPKFPNFNLLVRSFPVSLQLRCRLDTKKRPQETPFSTPSRDPLFSTQGNPAIRYIYTDI